MRVAIREQSRQTIPVRSLRNRFGSYLRQQVEHLTVGNREIQIGSYLRQQVDLLTMGNREIHALASVATW